jgi:endoglucanase
MYAGVWARSAGHPDDQVEVHASAATAERPTGTIISAPRGWYDAGDYNKYLVNSGISTGTLLMLYEHFPEYLAELETNIPESGNGVPDLLDEIVWNVRWIQAMQDPNDGGVYTKLTTANFEGVVMPNQATSQRYVIMKSTAAALNFVAVSALTARLIAPFESVYPGLADSLIDGANRAWNWAQINPEVPYNQGAMNQQFDPDINTGGYGDNSFFDEFRWAAAEMFVTTKQDSFMFQYPPFIAPALSAPGWNYVDPLAFITLSFHGDDIATVIDTAEINQELLRLANQYVNIRRESPIGTSYGTSSGDFFWGCNSLAANEGVILLQAYRLTGDPKYLDAALANLDYLLGRNATGFSFLTGFGDKTPMHPHHRQSQSDGIDEPVPGLLAGGPNPGMEDGCTYPSSLPAKSYLDDFCSYASNEIAINWNAPFAYLAGALDAIYSPTGRPVSNEPDNPSLPDRGALFDFEFGPNPSSDTISFEFTLEQPEEIAVRVFDMLGREVARPIDGRSFVTGSHHQSMNVDGLPTGLYAITFATGSRRVTRLATVIR